MDKLTIIVFQGFRLNLGNCIDRSIFVSLVNTYEASSIFEAAGGRSKNQSQVELVKMPKKH